MGDADTKTDLLKSNAKFNKEVSDTEKEMNYSVESKSENNEIIVSTVKDEQSNESMNQVSTKKDDADETLMENENKDIEMIGKTNDEQVGNKSDRDEEENENDEATGNKHVIENETDEIIQNKSDDTIQNKSNDTIQNKNAETVENKTYESIKNKNDIRSRIDETIENKNDETNQNQSDYTIQAKTHETIPSTNDDNSKDNGTNENINVNDRKSGGNTSKTNPGVEPNIKSSSTKAHNDKLAKSTRARSAKSTKPTPNKVDSKTDSKSIDGKKSDANKPASANGESAKKDAVKNNSNKSNSGKQSSCKGDSNKSDKSDASKGSSKIDSHKQALSEGDKSDVNKQVSSKPDSTKTDKTESTKIDINKSDSKKTDSSKNDSNKICSNKSESNDLSKQTSSKDILNKTMQTDSSNEKPDIKSRSSENNKSDSPSLKTSNKSAEPVSTSNKSDSKMSPNIESSDKSKLEETLGPDVVLELDTTETFFLNLSKTDQSKCKEDFKDDDKKLEKEDTNHKATRHAHKDNPKSIWITNISRSTKASDLKMHLAKFGKVTTAKIVTDGKLYYGYVIVEKSEDVNVCIKNLDGTYFEGRKINLSNKGPESIKETKEPKSAPSKAGSTMSSKERRERKPTPKLQNKSPKSRRTRSDMVREVEQMRRRMVEEDRRREERRREERIRDREREERRRVEMEGKLREARKKLEQEREDFEREKIALIKLQKMLADTERNKIKQEKDNIKKEIRGLEAGMKRRKSEDMREYDRKAKLQRINPVDRRKNNYKDSWRYEEKASQPKPGVRSKIDEYKYKRDYFSPKQNKTNEEKMFCVAPPPPKLSDEFDYSHRDSQCYRKTEYTDRTHRMEVHEPSRKQVYPDHRDKKPQEKPMARFDFDRNKVKYPSTIGGFPNGKPDFMETKHYENKDVSRGHPQQEFQQTNKAIAWKGPAPSSSMYIDHWKQEPNVQRYQFSTGPFQHQNVSEYYQQEPRYEYHGRKY